MRTFLAFAAVLALAVSAAMPVAAHSIKDKGELDRLMGDKEKFFQPLDKEAPDFTLQDADGNVVSRADLRGRSEEHTSELQSLMRISYAVFCLKKKTTHTKPTLNKIQ